MQKEQITISMQNDQVTSSTSSFKTFAFIDLETTGLPSLEFNRTKITQISIVACSVEHILDTKDKIPRVLHKLSMCFNPRKLIKLECSEITGLTNELLEKEKRFDENSVDLIANFLTHLQQPVCLVAHNGNRFDYPILKSQCKLLNKSLPESLICCDSLDIFRKIDQIYEENSKTLINGYKLSSWENIKPQQILLMDAEILEIEQLVKDYDSNDDKTISQLETEFINSVVDNVKTESADEKNEIDDVQQFQLLNETTPSKPVKNEEKNPPAKQPQSSMKRSLKGTRRELFPGTNEQIEPSKSSPKNEKKKSWPKGYYTLRGIYKRFFDEFPENSHDAEADVIALLKCVCACKKEFLDVAMKTAVNF